MNITSEELYNAIVVVYKEMRDAPEEHETDEHVVENIEDSARDMLHYYHGIVSAQRAAKQQSN